MRVATAIGQTPVNLRFWRLREAVNIPSRKAAIWKVQFQARFVPRREGSRREGSIITSKVNRAELMSHIDKILGNAQSDLIAH
jgi:hypothetical protein